MTQVQDLRDIYERIFEVSWRLPVNIGGEFRSFVAKQLSGQDVSTVNHDDAVVTCTELFRLYWVHQEKLVEKHINGEMHTLCFELGYALMLNLDEVFSISVDQQESV